MDLTKEIQELKTITNLLETNHIESINRHHKNNGWHFNVEYESNDEMIILGRVWSYIKGATFSDHVHKDTVEFMTLLKGSVTIKFPDDEDVHILDKKLSSFIIAPDRKHSIENNSDDTEIIYVTIPADPGLIEIYRGLNERR